MVLSFHEKTATLFQNILIPEEITGGTVLNSAIKLRYQACSDRICLPPKTEELSIDISIGKGIFVGNINFHSLQLTLLQKTFRKLIRHSVVASLDLWDWQ
ncbi:MAG: hypothetical protein CM1200mP28_11370 [Deltaproteobacteria bacterium]|nr:MAG: hypothetical protein CM1200mP28_11370 [Deltaproteobacteria bacterium]